MQKRKFEIGILGVKKDPANPILFSFSATNGTECPSSDSEDSDYRPEDEDEDSSTYQRHRQNEKKRKIAKGKKQSKTEPSLQTPVQSDLTTSDDTGCDNWGQYLPPEILLRIFKMAVRTHGGIPFLIRVGRVCNLWHGTSLTACLWEVLDLSYGWIKAKDQTIQWLCQNRLEHLREISLSRWSNLTDTGMKELIENHPEIENLNISYCSKITSSTTKLITEKCTCLRKLDISFSSINGAPGSVMTQFVSKQGPNLELLNVAGNNKLVGYNNVLNAMAKHCINMRVFDISNCTFSAEYVLLNIEKLQHGCPKLQVLRIANSKFRPSTASHREQAESHGFPELEEFSVAANGDKSGDLMLNMGLNVNGTFLHRILKNSYNLKLLDVRGCHPLKMNDLVTLPITDLQYLYMSRCSAATYTGLDTLLSKWRHSLLEVDLSWNTFPSGVLESGVEVLADAGQQGLLTLHTLVLAGTGVSEADVRNLMLKCSSITSLDLNSCRGLPRGWKAQYDGDLLMQFRKSIKHGER